MKKLASAIAIAGLITGIAAPAHAASFTQIGDTGQTLDTAQAILGNGESLDSISGRIAANNTVGLFKIFLTGGQTFSATTVSAKTLIDLPQDLLLGIPTDILADPQLFLFDANGKGIYGNDDSFGSIQATLPSGGFAPSTSGVYFLAIASSGLTPVGTSGNLFGTANATGIFAPVSDQPLISFIGQGSTIGTYDIFLTGAAAVPEPEQTAGMIAAGALLLVHQLKRWKSRSFKG
jgi:hypothetical protein